MLSLIFGKPTGCLFLATLIVAPIFLQAQPAPAEEIYSEPMPRNWAAPVYPPEAIKAGVEGQVIVSFVVDAEGRVVDPSILEKKDKAIDPRLSDAVLTAARGWTFAPALDAGEPRARAVAAPIHFVLKGRSGKPSVVLPLALQIAPTKPLQVLSQPDPIYPDELLMRKLPGAAEYQFNVGADGQVKDIAVLYASDASFVAAGIETLQRWTFEPARQGPLRVESRQQAPMEFVVYGDRISPADVLRANGISGLETLDLDSPPAAVSLFAPAFPHALLSAGETGTAEVEFTVDANGATRNILVTSASRPEFGESLLAAVSLWAFKPAQKNRERVPAAGLHAGHDFAVNPADPEARLVETLKTGVAGAAGLDQRLQPLWRIPPRYPEGLTTERPGGRAVVEFIIDRDGRARFPRVVSATHEAFGWSAAAAISQWVFVAPLRKGEPTDVLVSIPVDFAPPEQ